MSKSNINYATINATSLALINDFANARINFAKEDLRHKEVMKSLKDKLEVIKKNRENDLAQGMSSDEVTEKHSTVEVENAIRAEEFLHEETVKPINEAIRATFDFVSDDMYPSYVKKVNEGKRGDYLTCVSTFLTNIGIESTSQSALSKLSEQIADRLGARVSTSKALLEKGQFSTEMKKGQFNKLFMSVFCDILIARKVITVEIGK